MTSFENSVPTPNKIENYSLPSELLFLEKKRPRKSSILKKKAQISEKSMIEDQENEEKPKEKIKLSFETPVYRTYSVENWKEYNTDASKDDELCICCIY